MARDPGQSALRVVRQPGEPHSRRLVHQPRVRTAPMVAGAPVPLTELVGRGADLDELCAWLSSGHARLVTLVGPAGVGKTRLAIAAAQRLADEFADGARFVDLASVRDPQLVLPVIARALGMRDTGAGPVTDRLRELLGAMELLLVLDNLEQITAAGAQLAELVGACPSLTTILTSREALRLQAERRFLVKPLAVPSAQDRATPVALRQVPAVSLFVTRAQAIRPGFRLGEANAAVVADLCTRLDGLPLAIELAAARSNLLSPAAILARLDRRLEVLAGGARDLPARHQTLRAAIAWSYDLLTADEQRLLRRLAVFVGGWTLEAAAAVDCDADAVSAAEDGAVLDTLTALVDKSLVQSAEQDDGERRFRMLESVREYARELLDAHGELEAACRRHAHVFLALAERTAPELRGARQRTALEELEREHDNLRAALAWSAIADEVEVEARLCAALHYFWYVRGYLVEGDRRLAGALARSSGVPLPAAVRATLLQGAGLLAWSLAEFSRAEELVDESLAQFRELDDRHGVATGLHYLGAVSERRGEYAQAATRYEESLRLRTELDDTAGIAATLLMLGNVARQQGDHRRAAERYEESLALERQRGDRWRAALALASLGNIANDQGQHARAVDLYSEALRLFEEIGDKSSSANTLINLGQAASYQGDRGSAATRYGDGIELAHAAGDRRVVIVGLESLGRVIAPEPPQPDRVLRGPRDEGGRKRLLERWQQAARLLGAADALRAAVRLPRPPSQRGEYEAAIAAAHTALGEDAFTAAWRAGQGLSLDEAVRYALAAARSGAAPAVATVLLTRRERDVALLVAQGLTNRQIAAELVISERTADTHVANILNKLGFTARTQVAVWAAQHGLVRT